MSKCVMYFILLAVSFVSCSESDDAQQTKTREILQTKAETLPATYEIKHADAPVSFELPRPGQSFWDNVETFVSKTQDWQCLLKNVQKSARPNEEIFFKAHLKYTGKEKVSLLPTVRDYVDMWGTGFGIYVSQVPDTKMAAKELPKKFKMALTSPDNFMYPEDILAFVCEPSHGSTPTDVEPEQVVEKEIRIEVPEAPGDYYIFLYVRSWTESRVAGRGPRNPSDLDPPPQYLYLISHPHKITVK